MKAGWRKVRLENVCRKITDGSHFSPITTNCGYPYITVRDINNDQIDFDNCKFINETDFNLLVKNGCRPYKGDVLFSKDGTVGKVTLVDYDKDFVVLSSLAILRPENQQIDPVFLKYVMKSPAFLEEAIGKKTGAAIRRIVLLNLKTIHIPLPPLPEQQRIVGILDKTFDGIATAKANAEKNLQNARALFESHLESVFTQRGKGWVEKTLSEVCNFVGGSQPPKSTFSKNPGIDKIRLIQIRDYKSDNHKVFISLSQARRVCNKDDVMIGRYGPPIFQILKGLDGAYNVALMKAVPNEKILTRDYLFYFLKHSSIQKYVIFHSERAAGQSGLNKDRLEPYPIALPSLATQAQLVKITVELENETQHLESIYRQKLTALEELKKSLLHQAFSGEL